MDPTHALFNGLTFYFMAPSVMHLLGNRHFLGLYFLGVFIPRLIVPRVLIAVRWHIRQSR
jgi:membrane associated rhomboid family serine protease